MSNKPRVMQLDVDAVLRQKLPRHYQWIPRPLVSWVKRTICQDRMNALMMANADKQGAAFAHGVLDHLNVSYRLDGHPLPDSSRRNLLYVSNHPLGGLDGLALIDMVGRHHGVEPWFVVNDILMAIEPLRPVFVPINKHGRQGREGATALEDALRSDRPVIIFPAGLVSRRRKGREVADLNWRPSFVNYAVRYGRDIVPLRFNGENSPSFYRFARWRERLGIKLNIEMVYLPRELFRAGGKTFTISSGELIACTSLQGGSSVRAEAAEIRAVVDAMKPKM